MKIAYFQHGEWEDTKCSLVVQQIGMSFQREQRTCTSHESAAAPMEGFFSSILCGWSLTRRSGFHKPS